MPATIICGPPRIGKTAFLAHILELAMFDRERYLRTVGAIMTKQAGGFPYTIPPVHAVYAGNGNGGGFTVTGRKFRYRARRTWHIDPRRLGFQDNSNEVICHFLPPYSVIGVTEAQDCFDARAFKTFKRLQSGYFEQHGHMGYDIYMDVQRYDLIDKNIRELCSIIEIISKESLKKHGRIRGTRWVIRKFESCSLYERYLTSGKREKCYVEEVVEIDYDIHRSYNSTMCEPKFYEGHLHHDFDYERLDAPSQTLEGYADYFRSR